jgi:predicted dithiol-disulfide oxidoreductase (DUF899 family)
VAATVWAVFDIDIDALARGDATYKFAKLEHANSDMPGISVFAKDETGAVFRTYSTYGRGLDTMNTAYHYLDFVPKGRDESGLPFTMTWVKLSMIADCQRSAAALGA